MFARIFGASVLGLHGHLITVESDIANGLPAFDIVGLATVAVKESKERVRAAVKNSGFEFPMRRITVNLAPADMKKEGAGLDLAIGVALMVSSGQISGETCEKALFIGELSLDGGVRPVAGVLSMVLAAAERGFTHVFVSPDNVGEALLCENITVYETPDFSALIEHLRGVRKIKAAAGRDSTADIPQYSVDYSEVQGQVIAKRALEIAAAGGHNLLMVGPPGAGKIHACQANSDDFTAHEYKRVLGSDTNLQCCRTLSQGRAPFGTPFPQSASHHFGSRPHWRRFRTETGGSDAQP